MSDRRRGEFILSLDRPRLWRLRWKDAKAIEQALEQTNGGKPVNWMQFRQTMTEWSIDEYAIVLWAGLRHEDPKLTPEQVLDLADWTTCDEFATKMAEEIEKAIPESIKKKLADSQKEEKSKQS